MSMPGTYAKHCGSAASDARDCLPNMMAFEDMPNTLTVNHLVIY